MRHSFQIPGLMCLEEHIFRCFLFQMTASVWLKKQTKQNTHSHTQKTKQKQKHELNMQQCRNRKQYMLKSLVAFLITLCIFYTFYIQTSINRKWRDKQLGCSDCCCDLLGLCGLHLQYAVAILVAIVAEQVIWRRLTSLDDKNALWGQGGKNGERIHVNWDPGDIRGEKRK